MAPRSSYHFAGRVRSMSASIIREILKVSSRPGVTSFAGGLPAPETFPIKEFERAVRDTLQIDGTKALQYIITEGHRGLREYLCRWMSHQEINATPETMLLTHGSQQGLELLGKIFLSPGDSILVEDPTYLGAIQCFNAYETNYVTVPIDEEGMDLAILKKKLKERPARFIYVVPTFQNPSGITWTRSRRKALIELARERNLPIVEDDPYSLLRFQGESVPSIYSLAKGKGVIYLTTFSKLLSPGIRLGFMLAEPAVMRQLIFAKQAADLQTNTFIQYAVYHYCRQGSLEKHIPKIIKAYKHRSRVMMEAIDGYFPPGVATVRPEGGMFVWCRLPKPLKSKDVFEKAIRKNVAFVDGSVFYANGGGENTFRLNFTNSTDSAIRSGIKRLGAVLDGA